MKKKPQGKIKRNSLFINFRNTFNKNNLLPFLTFSFILLITLIPRLLELFSNYDYFGYEQGIDYLITKSILIDHNFPLIGYEVGGLGGFSKGPGWNYLLTLPFLLTNGHPFGGKLFMFLLSALTPIITFILLRKITSLSYAFFISFFLSIAPSLINHAGIIWPPFAMPILITIFLYCIYRIFQQKYSFLPIAFFLTGLMSHFEVATAGILFIQISILSLILLIRKIIPRKEILLSFLLFTLTLLPMIAYDITNNFYNTKGVISLFTPDNKKINISSSNIFENRIATFSWNFQTAFTPNKIISPLLIFTIIIGILLYLKDTSSKLQDKKFLIFLTLTPTFTFIFLFLYKAPISEWWLLHLTLTYCYILGIILSYFWTKHTLKFISIIILTSFLIAFTKNVHLNFITKFTYPPKNSTITRSIPIDYLFMKEKLDPSKIKILAPRKNIEEYEYLIWLKKYQNTASSRPNTNAYVIIEHDPSDANYYQKDLKNFIKNKTLISTKYLDPNFTIQTYTLKK